MNRRFSARQKRLLLWLAAGSCSKCGCRLPTTFHADHVVPYSKGGLTVTRNGQALCPPCNLGKGAR